MKPQKKPSARRERALQTRRRILRAAYTLFQERGYAGTTMDAIAREAGVAVQTMYFTFHTKAALLDEVLSAAVIGFDIWAPPPGGIPALDVEDVAVLRRYHTWFEPMEAALTAQGALEVFVAGGVDTMERAAPLAAVIQQASGDPEAKRIWEVGLANRLSSYRTVLRVIAKKPPGLRDGLTPKRGLDILFAVFSPELYQLLRDRGWKPREVQAWLLEVLGQQLFAA